MIDLVLPELVLPDLRYADSWLAAVREFGATTMHGSGLWGLTVDDARVETLAERIPGLLAQSDHATVLPPGRVHSDYWWLVDGDEFVGYLAIRHQLTGFLLREGGHIGYAVRPSRRRKGHATRALEWALVRSRELGLERVLVTCEENNTASRRTIELNGGVLEDIRNAQATLLDRADLTGQVAGAARMRRWRSPVLSTTIASPQPPRGSSGNG